ncbi:unnamed protein product [Laminaria digitata]
MPMIYAKISMGSSQSHHFDCVYRYPLSLWRKSSGKFTPGGVLSSYSTCMLHLYSGLRQQCIILSIRSSLKLVCSTGQLKTLADCAPVVWGTNDSEFEADLCSCTVQ